MLLGANLGEGIGRGRDGVMGVIMRPLPPIYIHTLQLSPLLFPILLSVILYKIALDNGEGEGILRAIPPS